MNKNVSIACGLGDLFVFLTKLEDFFSKNTDYDSIKFWTWNHSPNLAKELVSLSRHNVSIMSVEDMTDFLKKRIAPTHLQDAEKHFIKQSPHGAGVENYIKFMNVFFPNMESWIYLPTYLKYKTEYPFKLNVEAEVKDKKYFVVHPVSASVSTEKQERTWNLYRWGGLISAISTLLPEYDIYMIGTQKDKKELANDFPTSKFIDLRGKLSFTDSVKLVYGASAVFGINSWPTLMSSWAGIPTYSQWFVQNQMLSTHTPPNKGVTIGTKPLLYIEKAGADSPENSKFFPSTEQAFINIKGILNAAGII